MIGYVLAAVAGYLIAKSDTQSFADGGKVKDKDIEFEVGQVWADAKGSGFKVVKVSKDKVSVKIKFGNSYDKATSSDTKENWVNLIKKDNMSLV